MTDIATTASPARSIVFIDSRVQDAATLLQGLDPGTEVVFLQAGQDGLAQMAAALGEQGDVAAVQVIAHGSAGQLWLGSRFLDNTTLQQPEVQALLASLGRGLTAEGDLLVYACNTAQGSEGAQFVSNLAALTGADVAASDDRTGAGGDWELEISSGALQTGNFLNGAALTQYAQDLILRTVTSNADNGVGTLRQTIIDAGAGDTITFNAGMSITLTTGQLSIAKNLTIDGDLDNDGTADVTVNGNAASRVLDITSGTVVLDGLTITNGKLAGANGSGGSALGAGISVTGGTTQVNILHSGISGNAATGGTGSNAPNFGFGTGGTGGNGAGGLYVGSGATVQMAASTLTGNTGTGGSGGYGYYAGGTGGNGAGGLYVGSGGTVQMAASTLTGNTGTGGSGGYGYYAGGTGGNGAGGLYVGSGGTVQMAASTLTGNTGTGGSGGYGYDAGGTGGNGTGGVLVAGGGTFRYQSGTVTISSNTGTDGIGGDAPPTFGTPGSFGTSSPNISGSADNSWVYDLPPSITSAAIPANATYAAGQNLYFSVTYNEAVTVNTTGGTPSIALMLDTGGPVQAVYIFGSGSDTLFFRYTVAAGNLDANGITAAHSISLNGGTIQDSGNNNAPTTGIPFASTTGVLVDAVAPSVSSINRVGVATTNATSVDYTVTFSETVTGVNAGDFTLISAGASGSIAAVSGSGSTYTVTVNGITGDGTLRLDLKNSGTGITDVAGNAITGGYTSGQTYAIDNTAPAVPIWPDLESASDTGVSSSDNITSDTTPTFRGTAEAGSRVTLYDSYGMTALGTAAATGGNWAITSTTLAEGTYSIMVTATDTAGNVSAASAGLPVTIDTTAPTLGITSNVSTLRIGETADITFAFSEDPGATFTLGDVTVSGGTLGPLSGTGLTRTATFTPAAATNGGTASITVAAGEYTDTAGNSGGAGATPTLTFDTLAPAAPSAPDLAAASDTGVSSSDDITSNTTPTFTGTAEAGSTVRLYDTNGSTLLGTATADGSGNWSITSSALLPGAHTLTAKATDAAGNVSSASAGLTVHIAAPAIDSATYNASTGVLVVSGTGFSGSLGAANDIVANKFSLQGEGGMSYTLTTTSNVEISSATSFTLTLSAADRMGANLILNKNGTSSTGAATYNLIAAEDWAAGADAAVVVADLTGNGITVSNVVAPTVTSATYNVATGVLVVTGADFLTLAGANNDIVANRIRLQGQGAAGYTLTDTSNVDITSNTSFTVTMSATDRAALALRMNKDGTSATDSTIYNLGMLEDWNSGADAPVGIADLFGNGITVSGANAAPVATTSGGSTAFVEGANVVSTPVAVDSGITLSDADNTTLASATVAITGNFQSGEDLLALTSNPASMGNITASYDSATGVLTLSSAGASATLAQWQAALRAATYTNSSETPNTASRTLSFTVNDGASNSSAATRVVTVAAVNDAPVAVADSLTVAEGGTATTLVGGATSVLANDTDGEASTLVSVLVTGPAHGSLTLNANGTFSYVHNGSDTTTDSFSYKPNDGTADGNTVSVAITVTPVNDAPTITGLPGSAQAVTAGAAAALADFAVADADGAAASLTVTLTATNGTINGLTDADTNQAGIQLSGTAAAINAAIASATFTAGAAGAASIGVSVSDGIAPAVTGTYHLSAAAAAVNNAPTVANAVPDQTASEGSAFNFQFAANTFADVDVGDTLSYTAQLAGGGALPAWLTFDPGTRTFSGTPANVGTVSIKVVADDGHGGTVSDRFELVIGAAPVDPGPDPVPPVTPPVLPPTPGIPDNDGVPSTVEDQAPGIPGPGGVIVAGDGNGDGIKDSQQAEVASITFLLSPTVQTNPGNAAPTFTTLVTSSQDGKVGSGNDNSRILSLQQLDAPQDVPGGMQTPLGLVSFTVALAASKTGENFSLYLDPALGINGYWKQDASGTWVNLASEPYGGKMVMEGGRLRLDFRIEDGGQFDADGKADGIITDPGAPAYLPLSIVGQAPELFDRGFWF